MPNSIHDWRVKFSIFDGDVYFFDRWTVNPIETLL